jgi:hypothetical protein
MLTKERGATALLVAASLLVLIGFAAVAVDLSAGFNERRQGQTAADLGALAGAIEYVKVDPEDTLNSILDIVRANLNQEYADPVWIALWEGCTDTPPPGFNPWPITSAMKPPWNVNVLPCISGSADEIRVRLPDQIIQTSFGGVLGANSLTVNAVAHAKVTFVPDGWFSPFGVLSSATTGQLCLTTRAGSFPPCNGPDSGNFGTLNSQQWGSEIRETTTDCTVPGNPELATNIALGSDHMIGFLDAWYPPGSPPSFKDGDTFPASAVRDDDCQVLVDGTVVHTDNNPSIGPSTALRADTGFNQFQATKAGLVSDVGWTWENTTGTPVPLLQQLASVSDPYAASRLMYEKLTGTTYISELDNTPLWEYLLAVGDVPGVVSSDCDKDAIRGAPDPRASMNSCLAAWEAANTATPGGIEHLFHDEIFGNPRFIFVPQFHSSSWGSGNHWQPIKGLRVAYLDTMWFNCNGSFNNLKNTDVCDGSKGLVFAPDATDNSPLCAGPSLANCSPLRLDQFTAFLLPAAAPVSEEVLAKFPNQVLGPFDIQLTR